MKAWSRCTQSPARVPTFVSSVHHQMAFLAIQRPDVLASFELASYRELLPDTESACHREKK